MSCRKFYTGRFFLFVVLLMLGVSVADRNVRTVEKWAARIGSELEDLAKAVARPHEIKDRYRELNARVEDKSGAELIDIIGESVGRMLRRKMDAVRCILKVAESAAEEFDDEEIRKVVKFPNETILDMDLPYVSSKYSPVVGSVMSDLPFSIKNNSVLYQEMELESDSHFYEIPVNTNYSAVHVPTNIYDLAPDVNVAIQWSKKLDSVFRQNYRSDPALSWQYFGSSTGILRLYPAMQWKSEDSKGEPIPDLYDCRRRSWFIESATCSKDMVILLDVSGSMQGMSHSIGKATAAEIMDTLSNNDFVTVLAFTNVTKDVVPCFKNKLVQATRENIETFKQGLANMKVGEPANFTKALDRAFSLLEGYRITKGCNSTTPCTQAIMLLTDSVPGNLTEVFKKWNWLENGSRIPVRVFTYLLGRDVTNVREIQWMACLNRGYYSHIHGHSEVREQVLKYISVIARPLVLQKVRHPLIWTHAYADISNPVLATWLRLVMEHPEQKSTLMKHETGKQQGVQIDEDGIYIEKVSKGNNTENVTGASNSTVNGTSTGAWNAEGTGNDTVKPRAKPVYKLLTSVSMPAYDRKSNQNNMSKSANLLGVAGTDVALEEITKLTLPFKLGVNGYAFIVSNNGYVILHPDLRPAAEGELTVNYNSIDLTEVEILDDQSLPRAPADVILKLREDLVNHVSDSMTGVPVKHHYDDNRRVTLEKRDYFYAPLPETPFGLAIALPDYGTTWIKVGDEIAKNQHNNNKIINLFAGERWRVHPTWVYCRFHYLEGHEFDTVEEETRHFLEALDKPDWYWAEQYEEPDGGYSGWNETDEDGEARKLNCSRTPLDNEAHYCNVELMQLLVFDAKATDRSFTNDFAYRDDEDQELGDTYGVFLRFVATQSGLTRWQNIRDPWFVDEEENAVRKEFGDLHRRAVNEPWYKGAIFQHNVEADSLSITVPPGAGMDAIVTVAQGIFHKDGSKEAPAAVVGFQMPMIDFWERFKTITQFSSDSSDLNCNNDGTACYLLDQNGYVVLCDRLNITGEFMGVAEGTVMGSMLKQGLYKAVTLYDYQALCPNVTIQGSASSIFGRPFQHLTQIFAWFFARLMWLTTQFIDLPESLARKLIKKEDDTPDPPPPAKIVIDYYPCDKERTLYILDQDVANAGITDIPEHKSRRFFAEKVPRTNLILVVVDTLDWCPYERHVTDTSELTPRSYSDDALLEKSPCHKLYLNKLPRRGLSGCYAEHPLEAEIEQCGRASRTQFQISESLIIFTGLTIFINLF